MINKVILVGNLGGDPEIRYIDNGTAVANFSIATSERWKDKNTGEMQNRTEWHRIVAWRKLAEICNQYLSKGRQVYIEGRLQTREWKDKDGNKRYTTEVVANEMKMLGKKDTSESTDAFKKTEPSSQVSDNLRQPLPDEEDDEIPF